MEKKIFYRVGNLVTNQGLWYDQQGNFTGLIHNEFDFCKNSHLEMPYDENAVGFLSAVDNLNDLFFWFTKEDIARLEQHNYNVYVYESVEYKQYENHWLIKQDVSKPVISLPINSL